MHWQNLEQKDEKTLPEKVDPNVLDTDILVNISEDDDFLDNGSGSGSDIKKKGSARQSNTNKNEKEIEALMANPQPNEQHEEAQKNTEDLAPFIPITRSIELVMTTKKFGWELDVVEDSAIGVKVLSIIKNESIFNDGRVAEEDYIILT